MTMDGHGAMLGHKLAKTVIRSTERMTYEDCNLLLEDQSPELAARYAHILPMLRDMAGLARTLEKKRRARGALDLESRERYIVCDADGLPVDIRVRESGTSERLIESFMLAANECVAEHLNRLAALPAVYRVHEKPSADKATNLKAMLAPLGFALREADNGSLQKVLDAARGTPQAPAIHTMVLRSLMKARYDVQNLGHFGLAAKYYCHFTSPIRRYPDLMVHRILTSLLDGTLGEGRSAGALSAAAQRAAVQSSERELAAMSAEREIEKCYMAEFMSAHVGETFPGAVSGVTRFGLFVALANGVEGLLPVTALPDDRYEYDEVRMTLTGSRTKLTYSFGMPLEVLCAAANAGSGQIDFTLPGVEGAAPRAIPAAAPLMNLNKASIGRAASERVVFGVVFREFVPVCEQMFSGAAQQRPGLSPQAASQGSERRFAGRLAAGGLGGRRAALPGADVEPRLEGETGEEGRRGREVFVAESGVGAFEELFVERPPYDRDDVALFGSGDVGFGDAIRRQVIPAAEGEAQDLQRCDEGFHSMLLILYLVISERKTCCFGSSGS